MGAMSEILLSACVMLLFVLLAMGGATFHKVRRVHLQTFDLLARGEAVEREVNSLFQQFHALMALERRLQLPGPLPPMRGWAGSPDFLLALADELLSQRPRNLLECSSGVSTLVAARCMQLNDYGHVFSLEHDAEYAAKTRALLLHHGLEDWATVIDAPLRIHETETPWYSLESVPANMPPIDVLVVDGPPYSVARLARYPALPRLLSRLAPGCSVFLDDADRDAEREIVDRWMRETPHMQLTRLPCEKGLAVLRRSAARTG